MSSLLFLAPVALVFAPLLVGRYPGEDRLAHERRTPSRRLTLAAAVAAAAVLIVLALVS